MVNTGKNVATISVPTPFLEACDVALSILISIIIPISLRVAALHLAYSEKMSYFPLYAAIIRFKLILKKRYVNSKALKLWLRLRSFECGTRSLK